MFSNKGFSLGGGIPEPPVYGGWGYTAQPVYTGGYTTVTVPSHSAGDILLIFLTGYANDTLTNNPPAAGGNVPTWNALSSNNLNDAVWWARATSSSTTSGSWYTATVWWQSCIVISGAKQNGSPIGGNSWNNQTAGVTTAPAITPVHDDGSSLFVTLWKLQKSTTTTITPTLDAGASGYTRQNSYGWIANNSMPLMGGVTTKDDSSSDGSFSFGSLNADFQANVSNKFQIEVLSH